MGANNFNLDKFAEAASVVKANSPLSSVENIAESARGIVTSVGENVRATRVSKYETTRDMYNAGQSTIQVKFDTVSNIVSDACGLCTDITKAISAYKVEKEKTKQVQEFAMAEIRKAEEDTERVRIHEANETERFIQKCNEEVKKSELELERELTKLQNEKETILQDERKFNRSISNIEKSIDHLIDQSNACFEKFGYTDEVHRINLLLIELSAKIPTLYSDEVKRG